MRNGPWRARAGLAVLLLLPVFETVLADDPPPPLPKGDAERGATLYGRYCRGCHGVDGQGDGLVFMPHVNNLTRKGYIDQLPDSYLHYVILKGGESVGKSAYMPAWEGTLSTQDMADVIAHIRSLPTY